MGLVPTSPAPIFNTGSSGKLGVLRHSLAIVCSLSDVKQCPPLGAILTRVTISPGFPEHVLFLDLPMSVWVVLLNMIIKKKNFQDFGQLSFKVFPGTFWLALGKGLPGAGEERMFGGRMCTHGGQHVAKQGVGRTPSAE